MPARSTSIETMHREHRDWKSELGTWREEIDVWQEQLKEALRRHPGYAQQIGSLLETLAGSRSEIRIVDDIIRQHEHKMANSEHFGDTLPEWMTLKHLDIATEMEKLRRRLDGIRIEHRELIACLDQCDVMDKEG